MIKFCVVFVGLKQVRRTRSHSNLEPSSRTLDIFYFMFYNFSVITRAVKHDYRCFPSIGLGLGALEILETDKRKKLKDELKKALTHFSPFL